MLIKRIRAKNFKTYLDLDLDIESDPDKPIILIGGANGGGKTTFFEAIYGALYGLQINSERQFHELTNAGVKGKEKEKIELEIYFTGRVLNQEQSYVLSRAYILNTANKPVESVKLNMNGTVFVYGSATPRMQRLEMESQVNKIINGNLPEELSRYFLFDAMEAGNLLKENRLNKVIRENIENVMGFNRYLSLAKVSESLAQDYTAQRINLENERKAYLTVVENKKKENVKLDELQKKYREALDYSVSNRQLYEDLKAGKEEDSTISNKIKQLEEKLASIEADERQFRNDTTEFIKNFEHHIILPKLTDVIGNDISLILSERKESNADVLSFMTSDLLEDLLAKAVNYLAEQGYELKDLSIPELAERVLKKVRDDRTTSKYDFFTTNEITALTDLLGTKYLNSYNNLHYTRNKLEEEFGEYDTIGSQLEGLKAQLSGSDYSVLKAYEDNEKTIAELKDAINSKEKEIKDLENKIQEFDISTSEESDPKYETIKKLKDLFEDIANTLLKTKKDKIEEKMKIDLNANLAAYQDVISRVELSENLKDLNFRIYHKAGNEIYLSQLNTASTQVVVQVLLKALHEFGDYDPPVMIDTVMGVLDERSRATLLENYFPELSHQTILLSSDSEIRPGSDLEKIQPFVSKAFTLVRDKELQKSTVETGYFGHQIKG